MKTIEERAKTSYLRSNVQGTTIASSHEVGYIQGATEQRQIDKEEVLEALCQECVFSRHQALKNCSQVKCRRYDAIKKVLDK